MIDVIEKGHAMFTKFRFFTVCLVLSAGVAAPVMAGEAQEAYEAYSAKVLSGMTYEEDIQHYSDRKVKEVDAQFTKYTPDKGMTLDDMKELYLKSSQDIEKCYDSTLVSEEITDEAHVLLVYTMKNTCSSGDDASKEIRMVKENDAWKIDDHHMKF